MANLEEWAKTIKKAAVRLDEATTAREEDGGGVQYEDDDKLVSDLLDIARQMQTEDAYPDPPRGWLVALFRR